MKHAQAIGIFDSGIGGLSIAQAIATALPNEDLLYFADQKYSPYGDKPRELIQQRAETIVDSMVDQGCKAIVVACNTATVNTIEQLRSKFSIPIIGVEPGIKPAALQSKTGVIAVLATEQTLASDAYRQLVEKHQVQVNIQAKACPDFVTLVEQNNHRSEKAYACVQNIIEPLLEQGADQIVLGCTHFSFLTPIIEQVAAGRAEIVDTAASVAKQLDRVLGCEQYRNVNNSGGELTFASSKFDAIAKGQIEILWGKTCIFSKPFTEAAIML